MVPVKNPQKASSCLCLGQHNQLKWSVMNIIAHIHPRVATGRVEFFTMFVMGILAREKHHEQLHRLVLRSFTPFRGVKNYREEHEEGQIIESETRARE